MPSVQFSNITHRYGHNTIVENLNLRVDDGEFLVLLGPSGCGKTTLLHILAGLREVVSGSVHIGDRDVTHLDPKDRNLAMVFQSYALYPTKSVEGNLKFGLAAQRLNRREIEKRVSWAAKLLGLEPLLRRKPAQLSGGQRQRVAIGRALVKRVGLFLFDEPLSNLDAKLRTEMRREIKRLHAELQNTVVYVTHDQVEAMTMATQIAVMNQGCIQQIGTPDQVYAKPENLFVAGFIGSPPMNLLSATVESHGGKVTGVLEGRELAVDLSSYPFARPPESGQRIKVGMRPEHFQVGSKGPIQQAAQFSWPIEYFEKFGDDGVAFLRSAQDDLAVRFDFDGFAPPPRGELVDVFFPADKLSVFDAHSTARL